MSLSESAYEFVYVYVCIHKTKYFSTLLSPHHPSTTTASVRSRVFNSSTICISISRQIQISTFNSSLTFSHSLSNTLKHIPTRTPLFATFPPNDLRLPSVYLLCRNYFFSLHDLPKYKQHYQTAPHSFFYPIFYFFSILISS